MQKLNLSPLAKTLLVVCLVLLIINDAGAQETPDQADPSPAPTATDQSSSVATPQQSPSPAASPVAPRVVSVAGNVQLDDILEVRIDQLEKWAEDKEATKLVPYINGRAIKGNYPEELHVDRGRLIYHLEITPENKEVWIDLLGAPDSIRRPVTLSVGLEDGSAFDSVHERDNPLVMTVISPVYGMVALVVIAVTLVLLVWLAQKTNIIREPGPAPGPGKRRPYNLGRAQMAFWFFLIYASYVTIWLITDALDTITASLLALMGISAGTALSEALIDSGKGTAQTNQLQDLISEKVALERSVIQTQTQVDALNSAGSTATTDQMNLDALNKQLLDSRTRMGQIDQQISVLTAQTSASSSNGFLRDVLSDSSGYSFHRFQIFAWTIVLGIIFVTSVYNNLTMPEFSTTLLGLMGLSAGTYIGFKFPEQK